MAGASRFYVRSPDGLSIAGLDDCDAATAAALAWGDGAHLIDTHAQAYHPMAEEVAGGKLVYLEVGGWDTGRFGIDRDLIEAIKKGHAAIVHAFLAKGADADAVDDNGGPALLWAVARRKRDIVELLLRHGADPARCDGDGRCAADLARDRGLADMVLLLEQAGS